MKMRKIGGVDVSAMGYGAMSFSDFYGPTNEARSHAILDAALDAGLTHIDTSNVYGMGRSETFIASYFAANAAARDRFHIATKAGIARSPEGVRYYDNSLEHLESELDKSLGRMGIDHVDLFYIHRRDADRLIGEAA